MKLGSLFEQVLGQNFQRLMLKVFFFLCLQHLIKYSKTLGRVSDNSGACGESYRGTPLQRSRAPATFIRRMNFIG